MTPETLSRAGRCIHGHHWQVPLAHSLSVNPRTMRRWARDGAPDSIACELLELLSVKQTDTARAIAELLPYAE